MHHRCRLFAKPPARLRYELPYKVKTKRLTQHFCAAAIVSLGWEFVSSLGAFATGKRI